MGWKLIVHDLFEHVTKEPFHKGKDIVAFYEAHFHVKLRELELTVATCILVSITSGYLEVFVKAAYHEELFVQLWALWKGVELARIFARRHEEVSGALRSGPDEGWGLYFVESLCVEVFPYGLYELVSEPDSVLHSA